MKNSSIINEDILYLQFDDEGKTELIKQKNIRHKQGNSYRKVHYTREDNLGLMDNLVETVFKDPEWNIANEDIQHLDPNNGKVVLKRLLKLYPRSNRPPFFPDQKQSTLKVKDASKVPYFLTEINLMTPMHYKGLFITQDYQDNGLYHIIFNKDGRFETDVVDDFIPVYEDTQDPIWGMDIKHPWQIILLKHWAKISGGYDKVKNGKPFEFIEAYTNSNWKYENLTIEGERFLEKYNDRVHLGKFVCKTKFSQEVRQSGLVQGSAGYQIVQLKELNKVRSDRKYLVTIRSTLKNKWTGGMSVIDKEVNKHYESEKYKLRLERDFMMGHQDFLNLFSGVYIASIRDKHDYYSNYYLIDVPKQKRDAIYIRFRVEKKGFLDFVIKQFSKNRRNFDNERSRVKFEEKKKQYGEMKSSMVLGDDTRFSKIKYLLAYDNNSNDTLYEYPHPEDRKFEIPRYTAYEVEYSHGYNNGDAHFENIIPGNYILKIKAEPNEYDTQLCLNYCSDSNLVMEEVTLPKEQTSKLIRSSMVSLVTRLPKATLDKSLKNDQVVFANKFQEIGYGFVAIRSSSENLYDIMIDVDPMLLQNEGYRLKNQFKRQKEPFGLIVRPGESNALILKKLPGLKEYVWPPTAIGIFKDQSRIKKKAR